MELSKISNLSPANISINEIRLTPAQKMLLKLLTESVKNNIPITMDVMIDFYIKYVKKSETQDRHTWHYDPLLGRRIPKLSETVEWRKKWDIKSNAYSWFKLNIGAVVLKGKVLILPVIDIE